MAVFARFWCRNSQSHDLGSPRLADMTLSFILILSPKSNLLGLTIFSYKQIKEVSLLINQNRQAKTEVLHMRARSQQ